MNARAQFGVALGLQLIGAGVTALVATREWQTIVTPREAQQPAVLAVAGRTLDNAPLALGLVGLAGVVAILATQGLVRRGIGVLVALAGAGVVWRSAAALGAVSASRARTLVRDKQPRVTLSDTVVPHVTTHPVWGGLSIVGGVIVVGAGVLIALLGGRWAAMSARYERPAAAPDAEQARILAHRSLWNALDRGEDPTART
ncbi:Trp biosynthesis-associated membrane protein [Jatrophihabitans sp.]|uniref:Trp biosynthesis-associated membrane protein n=1 Tax=Jatrophihabitans sp. TaxID=1932789 RepID=UPI0030C6BC31|nr:hypothetical protein [Jatrophihabitans sp.]